jgi:hypothetical protein
MIHKDIIAKMDDFNIGLSNGFGDVKTLVQFVNALRAVVEMHNPTDNGIWCELCISSNFEYPCPTMETIDKEING